MANIDNVQLPDGSTYNIVDNTSGFATQNYVDSAVSSVTKTTIGLGNVDNTADNNKPVPIVECSTARSTANKAVALTGFTLKTGSRVYVRFTDTGTSNPASGNLTLNVNSTGAKTIVDGKTNKSVLTYSSAGWFYNNIVSEFVYDGTYWVWMSRDNNTTYSAMSASELTTGTATTLRTVRADYLKTGIDTLVSGKTNKTDIAPVESSSTASQAYAIGDQFYYNGLLYKATAVINSGGTITPNGNCTLSDTLVKQIASGADKGSVSVTTDGSKTYRTLLNELYAQMVSSKISSSSYLRVGNVRYYSSVGKTIYSNSLTQGSYLAITTVELSPSTSKMYTGTVRSNGLTITDDSSVVPQSGIVITFVY